MPKHQPLDFWDRAFLGERGHRQQLIEASIEARTRCGWRASRLLAIAQGHIQPHEPFENVLTPDLAVPRPKQVKLHELRNMQFPQGGVTAVPPTLPHQNKNKIDKLQIQRFMQFFDVFSEISKYLNMRVNLNSDPIEGVQDLWGLLDPNQMAGLYPTHRAMCQFEHKMIATVLQWLLRGDYLTADRGLKFHFCLTDNECRMLINMARASARKVVEYDQEEQRAIMILRLQDQQKRARRSYNLREELQSMKQEALVLGLTKTQPQGFEDMFVKVVRDTDAKVTKPKQLPHGTQEDQYAGDAESEEGVDEQEALPEEEG